MCKVQIFLRVTNNLHKKQAFSNLHACLLPPKNPAQTRTTASAIPLNIKLFSWLLLVGGFWVGERETERKETAISLTLVRVYYLDQQAFFYPQFQFNKTVSSTLKMMI